jgi:hypothetical protein
VWAAVRPVPLALSQEDIQQELRAFAQEKPSGFEAAAAQAAQYLWDKAKTEAAAAAV